MEFPPPRTKVYLSRGDRSISKRHDGQLRCMQKVYLLRYTDNRREWQFPKHFVYRERWPQIHEVVDTLRRSIQFNYDSSNPSLLVPITTAQTGTVARIHYSAKTIANTGFSPNFYVFAPNGPLPGCNQCNIYAIDGIVFPRDFHRLLVR
jgi:hypothetical protein